MPPPKHLDIVWETVPDDDPEDLILRALDILVPTDLHPENRPALDESRPKSHE